jgi:putative heme iron utilization protein
MPHESRLDRLLRELLETQRVAALGTLSDDGIPFISMTPYALAPELGGLVIHVSALAAHTRYLRKHPRASVMVMQPEVAGEPVHALHRVTLDVLAEVLEADSPHGFTARNSYLKKFPDVEFITELPDFRFTLLRPTNARQVAGFGAARTVDAEGLRLTFAPAETRNG